MLGVIVYFIAATTLLETAESLPVSSSLKKAIRPLTDESDNAEVTIKALGTMDTSRVTSIAPHPQSPDKLIYSDETRIYEFHLTTGSSSPLAGVAQVGLRRLRVSQDGDRETARFAFITKLVTRGQQVFVFDNDRLRVFNVDTHAISTVAALTRNTRRPVTGTVSHDGLTVFWYSVTDGLGVIYKGQLLNGIMGQRERVSFQRSSLSYCDISSDDSLLYVVDETFNTVRKVNTLTGRTGLVSRNDKYGAIAAVGNENLLVNDLSDLRENSILEFNVDTRQVQRLCTTGDTCMSQLSYVQNLLLHQDRIFVLDSSFWPKEQFSLKELVIH